METGAEVSGQAGLAPYPVVEEVSSLLNRPADEIDASVSLGERADFSTRVSELNAKSAAGDPAAFYGQQLLLSRIYGLVTQLPEGPTAEGSIVVQEVLRQLEQATIAAEDGMLESGILDAAPAEPTAFLSWLKKLAKEHRVYKHPYYREFIRDQATADDLRHYVIQESVVDGRFDDLLAMMQVGTSGAAKMEIAENFWDEMGNGDPSQVHTHLFNQIYEVFDISPDELERSLTANALLSGNLAVLLCRYRNLYAEAVGFLGMTEWLAPDRFVQVVHAWDRLGLPDIGIVYHKLHITVDSRHAAGWFHNVVVPAAESERMRRAIARGTLWRLNSSARYLDERMPELASHR
ncbi:iron-containing redox enzyme family protein [Streptomyces luteolus]|uniref:Iron-containing redox enzyme family protein n=1 Tax=Streptomyces luteolus TaxID=3043615 RepID=A0ABT6SXS1_9ACTN|nr:iron-containing redox enzyme family protein [Streptomyces sp. B-S-A12]MDI3420389.1 iron-containing redox enzyme family protein [Streptomyces sp. B-S-A12]